MLLELFPSSLKMKSLKGRRNWLNTGIKPEALPWHYHVLAMFAQASHSPSLYLRFCLRVLVAGGSGWGGNDLRPSPNLRIVTMVFIKCSR